MYDFKRILLQTVDYRTYCINLATLSFMLNDGIVGAGQGGSSLLKALVNVKNVQVIGIVEQRLIYSMKMSIGLNKWHKKNKKCVTLAGKIFLLAK